MGWATGAWASDAWAGTAWALAGPVAPTINDQTFYSSDGALAGEAVHQVVATGSGLSWSITAGNTNADWQISASGVISNLNTLNEGVTSSYSLTVEIDDGVSPAVDATITMGFIVPSTGNLGNGIVSSPARRVVTDIVTDIVN